MKKLYFHVGMGKTGSTAIQWFLTKNAKLLEKYDIYYPVHDSLLVSGAHHPIANLLTQDVSKGTLNSEQKARLNLLMSGFEESGCRTCLLSTEFASRKSAPAVKRLFPDFDIKIIFYIRPQEDFIDSVINQRVKTYKYRSTSVKVADELIQMASYLPLLDVWAEAVGKKNVILRRLGHLNGDLYRDFIGLLDMDVTFEDMDFVLPSRIINKSLSASSIRLLAILNRFDFSIETHKNILKWMQHYSEGKNTKLLDEALRNKIRDDFEEENKMILNKYVADGSAVLFAK